MNKVLLILIFLGCTVTLSSQLSVGAALESDFDNIGIKGQVKLGLTEEIALQGSYTIYFSSPVSTMLNLDGHYLLTTAGDSDMITVNALAGFNFWGSGLEGDKSVLGINIGSNVTFPISDRLDMFIEPKLTIISTASIQVAMGVYF